MEYQADTQEQARPKSDFRTASGSPAERTESERTELTHDWTNRKAALSHEWTRLTEEDIEGIDGNRRSLQERLETRYGWTPEESSTQIDNWLHVAGKRHYL